MKKFLAALLLVSMFAFTACEKSDEKKVEDAKEEGAAAASDAADKAKEAAGDAADAIKGK